MIGQRTTHKQQIHGQGRRNVRALTWQGDDQIETLDAIPLLLSGKELKVIIEGPGTR
jgi:hypothetical protein